MIADASSPASSAVEPRSDTVHVEAVDDGEISPGEEGDRTGVSSSPTWHGALRAAAYLAVSYILLYPILVSPVVADDYINPFVQADEGGTTLIDGLRFAWKGATEGASFRPLGGVVGSATTWSMLSLSATFDIGMSTLYSALKFILILLCATSIAWFWKQFSASIGRPVRTFEALVFVSLGLFSTLQIHAYWSNDPVANYPLVGFGATALGFVFLGCVMRFVRLRSAGSAAIAAIAALAAVSYYELNVSAVMAASLVLALFTVRAWSDRGVRWKVLIGSLTIVLVPAIFILAGRTVTGDQSQNYGGTTVRLGSTALRTFGLGLASSLPGAAWRLSIETLGGTLGIVTFAIAVTVLLGWFGGGWIRLRRGTEGSEGPSTRDPWLAVVLLAAMGTYWFVAVGIQAITVKVQDETLRLGFVYTSYAVGAAVIALGLAVAARWIAGQRRLDGLLPVVAAVALCFVLVQQTVNWRLSEQLNAALVPNRQLLASFDGDTTAPERCQALLAWTSGGWPDYYENGMIDGLDVAYEYYFGEPFCDGFVRPP
jgi:hypothetical protein